MCSLVVLDLFKNHIVGFLMTRLIYFREETDKLKEGEIDKIKNYSALCWSKSTLSTEQLNKLTELKVGQQNIF